MPHAIPTHQERIDKLYKRLTEEIYAEESCLRIDLAPSESSTSQRPFDIRVRYVGLSSRKLETLCIWFVDTSELLSPPLALQLRVQSNEDNVLLACMSYCEQTGKPFVYAGTSSLGDIRLWTYFHGQDHLTPLFGAGIAGHIAHYLNPRSQVGMAGIIHFCHFMRNNPPSMIDSDYEF